LDSLTENGGQEKNGKEQRWKNAGLTLEDHLKNMEMENGGPKNQGPNFF